MFGAIICPFELVRPPGPPRFARVRLALEQTEMGERSMEMAIEELANEVTKVVFNGRFDIAGAEAVDLKMNVIAGSKKLVLIDMQKVSFLGSMGLRTIVSAARAVRGRGGKIAVFGPDEEVEKVLTMSGVNALVPIHHDMQSAIASLQ
jgi:anti-sigma B factor antagonist